MRRLFGTAALPRKNCLPMVFQNWWKESITLVDWSTRFSGLGYTFCRRQLNATWRWRARRPHTHGVLRNPFKVQPRHSLLGCRDSFWWALSFPGCRIRVLSSPHFGDPAPLVEKPSNNHHIVAKDVLGHPNPVCLDIGCEIFPPLHCVLVDSPIM